MIKKPCSLVVFFGNLFIFSYKVEKEKAYIERKQYQFMSETILKLIPDGSLVSSLLENKNAINAAGDVDQLTIELFILIAKNYVIITKESDPSEGDDYRIKITEFGKQNLRLKK